MEFELRHQAAGNRQSVPSPIEIGIGQPRVVPVPVSCDECVTFLGSSCRADRVWSRDVLAEIPRRARSSQPPPRLLWAISAASLTVRLWADLGRTRATTI